MKKFILAAAAVAALAVGGVARADLIDDVGNTVSRIFNIPYDARPAGSAPIVGQIYTDSYGRRYGMDQWGRTVYLDGNAPPAYVERSYPYGNYAYGPQPDSDQDGVPNQYDRYPYDPRYR